MIESEKEKAGKRSTNPKRLRKGAALTNSRLSSMICRTELTEDSSIAVA
jgi:hypothetical protein